MKSARVFDGALLRADLFKGGNRRLFVSFRQRIGSPGAFDPPRPVRAFTSRGYAHLHIQSRWNDWFVNAETEALEAVLRDLAPGFRRVVAMGFSMGGYGAFRFSGALNIAQVIAIAPQISIAPELVPFDKRYRAEAKGFDAALGDLTRHGAPGLRGVVLCDPFLRADLTHALMAQLLFPRLRLCRLAGGGHPPSRVLRQGGFFPDMQAQLLHGWVEADRLIGCHRAARRVSPSYFEHMRRVAERHGRMALAERFAARAATVVPVVDTGKNTGCEKG
ncbi:alpha/beta hydrolase [Salipiger sp. P9]|uniref:alpha/beta hydrolase n=1 Tax=Salipiger pentaromativorans TaxID=2943193 RepID=UPI00215840B8|nr:alpha/beta hydrolase [Salipiger pentaromativorans]MCR8550662.1 alpha/beta hydrolase [Salipiger pentaromativorans]